MKENSSDILAKTAGLPIRETVGGTEYTLSPVPHTILAEVLDILQEKRRSPLQRLVGQLEGLTPGQQEIAVQRATELTAADPLPTEAEGLKFLLSEDGVAFFFWKAAAPNHPAINSLAAAREAVKGADPAELMSLVTRLMERSGFRELETLTKNSAPPGETTDPHESRGLGSISGSAAPPDGQANTSPPELSTNLPAT